jgi:hypothetical protein
LSCLSPRDDLFDHGRLLIRVVLNVFPLTVSELTLGALIQIAPLRNGAQPVAEQQHPFHLRTSDGEHVDVDVRVVIAQQAMFLVGLPELQFVAGSL